MKMKHLLGLVALFCVITLSPVMAQGKHRHHAAIEQKADAQDDKDENVAYSDTTSTAFGNAADTDVADDDDNDTASYTYTMSSNPLNMDHFDNPFAFFVALFGAGIGGIVLALFILLIILLVFLSPLIVVYIIYRFLKRLYSDKVRLTEKAIASGRPMAKSTNTTVMGSADQELWSKGVKNVALGLGLIMLFGFWGAQALCGIGALIMCLGIGKMVIARTSIKVEATEPSDSVVDIYTAEQASKTASSEAPTAETPASEVPTAETPAPEAPAAETPASEAPTADQPSETNVSNKLKEASDEKQN
ncbi:MAG: DUF6249 domain-containing protein [Prevotella sp.]|nr:DUF6249 domain-containing protein [Prevotella sp.]